MSSLSFPVETYRWLVALQLIPNEGILTDKNLVAIAPTLSVHFESGFNIGQIVTKILQKSGEKIPASLQNVKPDNSKNSRLTNWNFVWLSFDDLRMQFDTRIKDLILQGEISLITQIVKQLCDRDEYKDQKAMKAIVIKDRSQKNQKQRVVGGGDRGQVGKHSSLDLRKLNLQKDPDQAQSSLQFLILLLTSSLNMTTQEILGLFTNQNKYLAHVIAKGINQDFTGVILFYTLLNKYEKKLRSLCQNDHKDSQSCLYAIKPGFISKNSNVSELTIQLFSKLGPNNVYNWFVSQQGKGATTLLLGMKRHPHLIDQYWSLLTNIISNQQVEFFTTHFKKFFRDPSEMIEICMLFMQPLAESFLITKLNDIGVINEWLEIAVGLFEDPLEFKLMAYRFIGEVMVYYPEGFQDGEECLIVFKKDWKERKITDFVFLIDEIILILQKLAEVKNPMARKMYQIIIDIFETTSLPGSQQQDKKQYLVQNFIEVLTKLPGIPSHFLIQTYQQDHIRASDFLLIKQAIDTSQDSTGLTRIGQVILKMFIADPVVNVYQAPLVYTVAQRVADQQIGHAFIRKSIKDCLHHYAQHQIKKKPVSVVVPQPMYFNRRGNSKKVTREDTDSYQIKEKEGTNLMQLVEKLTDIVKNYISDPIYKSEIRDDLLSTNAMIRQNNFKIGSKAISAILLKKYNISKEEELNYDDDYKVRKSAEMEESIARKKLTNISILSVSRAGPQHLTKQFNEIVQKRKKDEVQKRMQEQKKAKEKAFKETLWKKQLQKVNLLKGFGGEAELKQQGFWARIIKQQKELQVCPPSLLQTRDIQFIENTFRRYHRLIRSLFLKYTSTMFSTRSFNNFQGHQQRNETVSIIQLIKFLKDYKLYFLTSSEDVKTMVRDINVKLMNKREVQELDFQGFQQFLTQFCILNMVKPHTISVKTSKGNQSKKKHYEHLSHWQLVDEFFVYLRQVFQERGQKTILFDEPEAAYFNQTQVIKEFNKQLEMDPSFILPEGYKKITEKVITFEPKISKNNTGISQSYMDVMQVLDQILFSSQLQMHFLEPIVDKTSKVRVKPQPFLNVKAKIGQSAMESSKMRALSTVIERKQPAIPPVKMLEKKTLSFGMKLGLSYVSYKDKLLGEQVAYVIDDILDAVQKNRNTIEKQKVMNDILRRRKELEHQERKAQSEKERRRVQRKGQLEKIKKQNTEKKQIEQAQNKEENEKKKQKQLSKEKKRKENQEKYLAETKARLKDKKDKQEQQKLKLKDQQKQKKDQHQKVKEKFKQFNQHQIQKLQKNFLEGGDKRKKNKELEQQQKVQKEQLYKKLRSKIQSQDQKAKQHRLRTNEQIVQLYHSKPIEQILRQFQVNLKAIFNFLIQNTYLSLTERKHNNQIIYQTWHYFNMAFQLSPLIVDSKEISTIFKLLTKDKQVTKQYYIGLNYAEFEQALLRVAIKHKSVFNKLADKIKQEKMTQGEINDVVEKDIQEKEKNQFVQPKQIDVKGLLKEEDVNKEVFDDYGDITKTTDRTLKGLIYYLKVPKDKAGQEKRFRQILVSKIKNNVTGTEKLKEKLSQDYTLASPVKKKRSPRKNSETLQDQPKNDSQAEANEGEEEGQQ